MHNIVDFRTGSGRPRRSIPVSQDGARILLFTGVRYVRDEVEQAPPFVPELTLFDDENRACTSLEAAVAAVSEACLDLAAH